MTTWSLESSIYYLFELQTNPTGIGRYLLTVLTVLLEKFVLTVLLEKFVLTALLEKFKCVKSLQRSAKKDIPRYFLF
jgi:hypothetical protein